VGRNAHDDLRAQSLTGDRGNQQYRILAGLDLGRYGLVVFCWMPFNQALAKAPLNPA
jgi:hypothetical protein